MAELFAVVLVAANVFPLGEAVYRLVREVVIYPDELTQREQQLLKLLDKAERQIQIHNQPNLQVQKLRREILDICMRMKQLGDVVKTRLPPDSGRCALSLDQLKRMWTFREERQRMEELGQELEARKAELNLAAVLDVHAKMTALEQGSSLPSVLGYLLDTSSALVYKSRADWRFTAVLAVLAVLAYSAYRNQLDKLDLMTLLPAPVREGFKQIANLDNMQAGPALMWLLRCALVLQLVLFYSGGCQGSTPPWTSSLPWD